MLTPTDIGTNVAKGKQVITVDGKDYLPETALKGDMCIIKGSAVDKMGNPKFLSKCALPLTGTKRIVPETVGSF